MSKNELEEAICRAKVVLELQENDHSSFWACHAPLVANQFLKLIESRAAHEKAVQDLIKVQKENLTDPYMVGLHNGLELALSCLTGAEPNFIDSGKDRDLIAAEDKIGKLQLDLASKVDLPAAVAVLTKALVEDRDYYYSWQANIAMAFKDEYDKPGHGGKRDVHSIANQAAIRFLSNLTYNVSKKSLTELGTQFGITQINDAEEISWPKK